MNFNIEHYRKYRRAAGKPAKDGMWDITEFPNGKYCFATRQRLGHNGNIDEHPMLGKFVKNLQTGEVYEIDSVCIHWQLGYYYHATLKDANNSHGCAIIGNINCQEDWILEMISEFNQNYEILNKRDNDR
jgi:hypothetical protein